MPRRRYNKGGVDDCLLATRGIAAQAKAPTRGLLSRALPFYTIYCQIASTRSSVRHLVRYFAHLKHVQKLLEATKDRTKDP